MGYGQEVIWAIVTLYEWVTGRVRISTRWTKEITNTIGLKQGCVLSPTLLGLYIDELRLPLEH